MKKFSLENKKALTFMAAFAVLLIGGVFAISQDSSTLDNSFSIADYKTSFTETFTSPTNWITCETKEKIISVTNNSSVPVAARISLAEVWKDADGNVLPLTFTDNNGAAQKWTLININTDDWTKDGYYHYYKEDLAPGATSSTFMTGVTLNCDANLNGSVYGNATYTLSATIQTIAAEQQDIWSRGAVLQDGRSVNIKLKTLAGTELQGTNPTQTNDYNIKTIRRATSIPNNFDTANPANIISIEESEPIYAWFDNTDNAGIIYIYSNAHSIKTGNDISHVCEFMRALVTAPALSDLDTSDAITMNSMFQYADSLTTLDVSGWDTSNAENMTAMFNKAKSLVAIDVSNWDTSKVSSMRVMFQVGDSKLGNGQLQEIIGLENWDTSNVTNMGWMFYGAGKMTSYNISNWDVSKVESFNHMFCDNFKLKTLDLSRWNTRSLKTAFNMFDDTKALTTIGDISHWSTSNLIDAGGFLNGATSFVGDNGTLDLSGWDTSSMKTSGEMFRATALTDINLSGWNFSATTNDRWEGAGVSGSIYYEAGNNASNKGLAEMFLNMPNLQHIYIDQTGKDSFDAAVARGVDVTKLWQGSPISDFTIISNP